MDPKEWLERNVGLPTDPAKQRDPEDEQLPAQGSPGGLNDVTGDGGGQRSEVGVPYDGGGDLQRGVEKRMHRDDEHGDDEHDRR